SAQLSAPARAVAGYVNNACDNDRRLTKRIGSAAKEGERSVPLGQRSRCGQMTRGGPMDILAHYVMKAPADQNVMDLFDGEWSSKLPEDLGLVTRPGFAKLFEDARVIWAE